MDSSWTSCKPLLTNGEQAVVAKRVLVTWKAAFQQLAEDENKFLFSLSEIGNVVVVWHGEEGSCQPVD